MQPRLTNVTTPGPNRQRYPALAGICSHLALLTPGVDIGIDPGQG
jgi:hypothetical protein